MRTSPDTATATRPPVDAVYGGELFYPARMAAEVLARFAVWVDTLPDTMSTSVVLGNVPARETVAERIRGGSFAIVRGCCVGPLEQGEQLVGSWREWAAPAVDTFGPMPFSEVVPIGGDPADPVPVVVATEWLADLGTDVARILVGAAFLPGSPGEPPPLRSADVRFAGGPLWRRAGEAPGDRGPAFLLRMVATAPTPAAAEQVVAHMTALRAELARHTTAGTATGRDP